MSLEGLSCVGLTLMAGILIGYCMFLHYTRRIAEALEKLSELTDRTDDLERVQALEAQVDYLKGKSDSPPAAPPVQLR